MSCVQLSPVKCNCCFKSHACLFASVMYSLLSMPWWCCASASTARRASRSRRSNWAGVGVMLAPKMPGLSDRPGSAAPAIPGASATVQHRNWGPRVICDESWRARLRPRCSLPRCAHSRRQPIGNPYHRGPWRSGIDWPILAPPPRRPARRPLDPVWWLF